MGFITDPSFWIFFGVAATMVATLFIVKRKLMNKFKDRF